jgi:predicted ester cyclase
MFSQQNVAVVRRVYEQIYNAGNLDAIPEVYASEFISHPNSVSHDGIQGPEGIREFVCMLRAAIPDMHFLVQDEIVSGDRVVTRWEMRGTLLGPLFGFQPTGKIGYVTGITIHRVVNGKVVEAWEEADMLGAFDQFGIIPGIDDFLD